jgi:hypothetical protein
MAIEPILNGRAMYGIAVFTRKKADRNGYTFDYGIVSQKNNYFLDAPIKRKAKQLTVFAELSAMMLRNINNQSL